MEDLKRQLDQKAAPLSALREIGRAVGAAWALQATLELITRKTECHRKAGARLWLH
jgi:hypothetical protein